jgi:GxxExxY protein
VTEEAILKAVLDEAFYVHKKVGAGMLENVYKTCLAYRLRKRGLQVDVERAVPVFFEEIKMDCGYRLDILVENLIVIEVKSLRLLDRCKSHRC